MNELPIELFDVIAVDEQAYRALLAIPRFARTLTVDRIYDFRIKFGHYVEITKEYIKWMRNKELHRLDGHAFETAYDRGYYANGVYLGGAKWLFGFSSRWSNLCGETTETADWQNTLVWNSRCHSISPNFVPHQLEQAIDRARRTVPVVLPDQPRQITAEIVPLCEHQIYLN